MIEDRTLRTARDIPFAANDVYAAFSNPNLLATWWGPEGFSSTFEIFEFSEGGRWKFVMQGLDGMSYPNENTFLELILERKIVVKHD